MLQCGGGKGHCKGRIWLAIQGAIFFPCNHGCWAIVFSRRGGGSRPRWEKTVIIITSESGRLDVPKLIDGSTWYIQPAH